MNRVVDGVDLDGLEYQRSNGTPIDRRALRKTRVFILYDPTPDKDKSGAEYGGFPMQAQAWYSRAERIYGRGSVAMAPVSTVSEFNTAWASILGENVAEVALFFHGKQTTLSVCQPTKQYVQMGNLLRTPLGTDAQPLHGVPAPGGNVSNAELYMLSCSAGSETVGKAVVSPYDPYANHGRIVENIAQDFLVTFRFGGVTAVAGKSTFNSATYEPELNPLTPDWPPFNRANWPSNEYVHWDLRDFDCEQRGVNGLDVQDNARVAPHPNRSP